MELRAGLIASWCFGVLFLVVTLAAFANPYSMIAGIPFLIAAVLLLPPVRSFVHQKTGKALSTSIRVVLIVLLAGVGVVVL